MEKEYGLFHSAIQFTNSICPTLKIKIARKYIAIYVCNFFTIQIACFI